MTRIAELEKESTHWHERAMFYMADNFKLRTENQRLREVLLAIAQDGHSVAVKALEKDV